MEQIINQYLNKYPNIKKKIKRVYQRIMYTILPKEQFRGDIHRISPDNNYEYFFGYYDKSPEDASGKYILCIKAKETWSEAAPKTEAEILLIDRIEQTKRVIATTHTWNVQQGCMVQWLGPDFDKEIIYNDFRKGKYCSIVLDVFSGNERILDMPIYSVSRDGTFALTLDFSRLHRLRPGYGYSNIEDITINERIPKEPCIWKIDIKNNEITPVLWYKDFINLELRPEMLNAEHKVNHIMISPNGKRFMVLHRWFVGERKFSRLVTASTDGSEMYVLSDDDMVSHCNWKNNSEILAFENKKGDGVGYYLMKDLSQEYTHLWPEMSEDGHPSYSPSKSCVVTDTYPNRRRIASIKIMNENMIDTIVQVFAPFKYDNDTRCDLHPRWSLDGKRIYFDSVHEGHRGLYYVEV